MTTDKPYGSLGRSSFVNPSKAAKIANWIPVFSVLVALIPILRVIGFIYSHIQNNLSVDDVAISPLIGKILDGGYSWSHFLQDSFINGHEQVWPVLVHLFFAKAFSWNILPILYFGIFLGVLKLVLIFDTFTRYCKTSLQWLLLPILSFLIFSPSQITVYEFEFPSMQLAINHLGFALGIWGLVRFRQKWQGVLFMVLGGLLASWSWANGVLVWPVFLLGLVLLDYRRKSYYLIWWNAALLISFPYVYFLFIQRVLDLYAVMEQRPEGSSLPFVSWFNASFIIRALAWPFSQNLSTTAAIFRGGVGGAFLLILAVILCGRRNKLKALSLAAPLMVLCFGLLNIWQISLFRWSMAYWYASPFMMVWIGMVGVAYVWASERNEFKKAMGKGYGFFDFAAHWWSEALLVILFFFYLTSNLSFKDKSFYSQTHTRNSVSCLRNFQTAPTYCEQTLFLWEPGQYQLLSILASPLIKHHLSVFSPKQIMSLQGDFILDSVKIDKVNWVLDVFWSSDLAAVRVPFKDTRPLNLFLHTPNAIEWKVTLPANLKSAEFRTAAAISDSAPLDPGADGLFAQVFIQSQGQTNKLVYIGFVPPDRRGWIPFSVPLKEYAGQTITLRLTSQQNTGILHDWLMYKNPEIVLEKENNGTVEKASVEMAPINTDLSENFVKSTQRDYVFDLQNSELWKRDFWEIQPSLLSLQGAWLLRSPSWNYLKPISLCLDDYSHLSLKVSMPPDIYSRAIKVKTYFDEKREKWSEIWIPLLSDGEAHTYSYDLKLLEVPRETKIDGIELEFPKKIHSATGNKIELEDLRFIRREGESFCKKVN